MKRYLLNLLFLVLVSSLMVACSKEEVKPYTNPASGSAVNQMRGGEENNTTTADAEDNVTAEDGSETGEAEEGEGTITDGGNSADYDTKGHKKKKTN